MSVSQLLNAPYTNPFMFGPVVPLMSSGAVFDQLAFTASHTTINNCRLPPTIGVALRSFTALRQRHLIRKAHIAVNPIAHLPWLDSFSMLSASFDSQKSSTFDPSTWKPYHLAVVGAACIGATTGEIVEDVL